MPLACLQRHVLSVHSYCTAPPNQACRHNHRGQTVEFPMTSVSVTIPVTAFVIAVGDQHVCVVNNKRIVSSKHRDYVAYHLRRADVKVLNGLNIEQIAYVANDLVTEIVAVDKTKAGAAMDALVEAGIKAAASAAVAVAQTPVEAKPAKQASADATATA